MSSNPIPLEVLRIEEPCHADWEKMKGDDRRRFCEGCQKFVHNFTAMTRDEAEQLICQAAGSLCARFARDDNGTVITCDYEKRKGVLARRGWRFWSGVGLFSALLGGSIQSLFGHSPVPAAVTAPPKPVAATPTTAPAPMPMGGICPPRYQSTPSVSPPATPTPPPSS